MWIQAGRWRPARRVIVGLGLTTSVSLATAAIIIWLPGRPVPAVSASHQAMAHDLSEYMQLHEARNAVVPNYLGIEVRRSAR